jgi:hypothetical protein
VRMTSTATDPPAVRGRFAAHLLLISASVASGVNDGRNLTPYQRLGSRVDSSDHCNARGLEDLVWSLPFECLAWSTVELVDDVEPCQSPLVSGSRRGARRGTDVGRYPAHPGIDLRLQQPWP